MSVNREAWFRASVTWFLAASSLVAGPLPAGLAASSSSVQKDLDAVAVQYEKLTAQLNITKARQTKLEKDLIQADRIIAEKAAAVGKRAGYMYKHGGFSNLLGQLLVAPDLGVFVKRVYYLELVGNQDSRLVETLRVTQSRADDISESLKISRARQAALVDKLREQKRQLEAKFKGVKTAAKVSRLGKFASFTLPIAGPTAFANTWGARRSGGRRHKGTDVMASCGAKVVAVTDGVIQNLHAGGNGGTMAYVRAGNGDVFFYAHLRSYAPGIGTGRRVGVGDLIGYNGNTGNARGGPCHVHFEWHPGGGGPVNPYFLLAAAR
jgi:murein DD-endopeptidase MepM/ murein hydrolase activator NlpD